MLTKPLFVGVRQGEGGGGCKAGVSFFGKRLYFSGKFDKMNSGPSFGIVSLKIEGFRGIKNASVEIFISTFNLDFDKKKDTFTK